MTTGSKPIEGELLPCPFCGSDNVRAMPRSGFIYCMGDDCEAEMRARSDAQAVRMWNTRALTKATDTETNNG